VTLLIPDPYIKPYIWLADYEPPKSTREKRAGREDLIPMSNVTVGKASVRAVCCMCHRFPGFPVD
jgi:hypothetical protein